MSKSAAWLWVALAWVELVVAYGGYLLYLRLRGRRRERQEG
ncbi:MAG: hypothetical protein OXH85_10115 [Truepera sp.]|nr:hypothetical protein [Truepera sp.]